MLFALTIFGVLVLLRDRAPVTVRTIRRRASPASLPPTRVRDGLLEYDRPDPRSRLRHPITGLIEAAKARWEARLARQSTTFEDAVAEYKRRYRRPPPKQFNIWWQSVHLGEDYRSDLARFARARRVKLIDVRVKTSARPDPLAGV